MKTIIFCASRMINVNPLVDICEEKKYGKVESSLDPRESLTQIPNTGECFLFILNDIEGKFPLGKDVHLEIALAKAAKLKNKECLVILCHFRADLEVVDHPIFDERLDRIEDNFLENFICYISNK